MMSKRKRYIWQSGEWPKLQFDLASACPALLRSRGLQGQLQGMASAVGLVEMQDIVQQLWTSEAIATTAI